MGATKRKAVRHTGGVLPTELDPQNYNVAVSITEPDTSVFYVSVNPETLLLNGVVGNTITWTLYGEGGVFLKNDDINFKTERGKGRFVLELTNDRTITATVTGEEEDQTIYTYEFTVHFPGVGGRPTMAVRVDPEVDNPPPPPR